MAGHYPRVPGGAPRNAKQDFGKVETGFPTKILLNQENLSRHPLVDQRMPA
jgi:hypothetical protein